MTVHMIDLSHKIGPQTPPWPGCPPVSIEILDEARLSTAQERHVNSSRFAMNIHCATHMDAPFHFLESGSTIDEIPLEQTYGQATLARLTDVGPGDSITTDMLQPWETSFRRTKKAIVSCGWDQHWQTAQFFQEYPDITPDAAQFLVDCGVHLVGVETGSIDYPPNPSHIVLLSKDVLIVECLTKLDQIRTDEFLFSASPLKLEGLDGSPVRAVAIVERD